MYVNYILCVNIQNSTGGFVVNTRYHAMRVNTANNLAPYGCHSLFVVINLNVLKILWCALICLEMTQSSIQWRNLSVLRTFNSI